MENMDKGLTVPKWVLIVQPKIPLMPQNLSAQLICPGPKVLDFNEKRLHWASVVHGSAQKSVMLTTPWGKDICSLPSPWTIILEMKRTTEFISNLKQFLRNLY
jgi:hypothetical protein